MEKSFKDISIFNSGGNFVQQSESSCAMFVEGIMCNISVKLFRIWVSGLGGDIF